MKPIESTEKEMPKYSISLFYAALFLVIATYITIAINTETPAVT